MRSTTKALGGDLDPYSYNNLRFGTDTTFRGSVNTTEHDGFLLDERSLGFLEQASNPRAPAAGTTVTFSVSVDNPQLTVIVADLSHVSTDASHALVTLTGSGTRSFVMPSGGATFYLSAPSLANYTLTLGSGGTNPNPNPTPENRPPVANSDSATTTSGQAVTINVLSNDTDPDNDPLNISISTQTAGHGTIVLNSNRTITYTPNPGYIGPDTFTYGISDGHSHTAIGNVSVNVTAGPPPIISATNPTIVEGDTGTQILRYTVSLSAAYGLTVTVNYGTMNSPGASTTGSAAAGADYTPVSGLLDIRAWRHHRVHRRPDHRGQHARKHRNLRSASQQCRERRASRQRLESVLHRDDFRQRYDHSAGVKLPVRRPDDTGPDRPVSRRARDVQYRGL